MKKRKLKEQIQSGELIIAPGIYDVVSALMADQMGFGALYVTGYGTVASYMGIPDAGIATYTDMLHRISRFAELTQTPIIADADTGYGGLLNVAHTVRGYEKAGVAAIQLEDQEFPKKCGHTPGRRVIAAEEMVKKIKVACDARASDDFLIVARTDARSSLGIDEAISRAQMYADAGADILFVESPETEEEMRKICGNIDKPVLANLVPGGKTPMLSASRLQEMGYAIAIHPVTGFLAAAQTLEKSYSELKVSGNLDSSIDLYSFAKFNELIGFPAVWEFDKKYAE
jgi:2-methylisocitrate lyase-like PEP mutase family enzyme